MSRNRENLFVENVALFSFELPNKQERIYTYTFVYFVTFIMSLS